jgi:hypothetical protein
MLGKFHSFGKFVQSAALFSLVFAVFGLALQTKLAAYSSSPHTNLTSGTKLSTENRHTLILRVLDVHSRAVPGGAPIVFSFSHCIHAISATHRFPYSVSQQAEIRVSHAAQYNFHPISTLRRPPPSFV